MTAVMSGVRVLEVAEHTFVPAASALLADWGAEVIKVEHVERGDAMRGLAQSGLAAIGGGEVHVLLEHSNHQKKSIGLDLKSDDGRAVLYRLAATSDVFLTNKVPAVRTALQIDVDDLRAHNPDIIYVRGTGWGERGPDASKGAYDSLAYWNRSGIAMSMHLPDDDFAMPPPAPGFGDSIGGLTIAGGIMGALFHRERTGEATTVDVSLLGVGIWSVGAGLTLCDQMGVPQLGLGRKGVTGNPLVTNYATKDGRFVSLCCLQATRYWPEMCQLVDRPELGSDERFADPLSMMANAGEATRLLAAEFATRTADECRQMLADFSGQWAMVQDVLEVIDDPQTVANGYIAHCETPEGTTYKLAAAPIQFGEEVVHPGRMAEFNEHGDALLEELGYDWDTIIDLKVRGVVA
jgi:crotonobetainyl-CoA:carnitine CoA-transferase CaiB-like acyl-CoA transferase